MEKKKKIKKRFRRFDGLKYGWLKDTKKFLLLFVFIFLLFRFVIGFSFIKGNSMEPTLHNEELVLYMRLHGECTRGDVVSVKIPSGEYYVKRIMAVAGDTIDIRDGEVYVNDKMLEEPYIKGETLKQSGRVQYPLTLQEGQIFVMGDNREDSMDSRAFGVVGERQIKGKIYVIWDGVKLKLLRPKLK